MSEADSTALSPGTVVSHFVIENLLGAGAMGEVWLGSDRRDGTRVAIKVLNAEFSRDSMFRQRFEREAHVATLLKSPYTVQTLAFGREQGHYYIVMEFVEGDSVEKMLTNGPLSTDEALEIATDTARALEAAATQRIVHRDLKPSNIIVSPDGAAKLVDFGIASQGASKDPNAGFMGTVQYAAPEQQKGEADERTDIYSLGATLFHMLAGRPPFSGRTAQDILAQHLRSPFPAALLSQQPELVVDIVRRCMQKDPADRYQTAHELASALDRVRSRLGEQRAEAPAVMPDQFRTTVPQPGGNVDPGATIVVGGARPPAARPPQPDISSEGTVVLGAPGRPAAPSAPAASAATAATVVSAPAQGRAGTPAAPAGAGPAGATGGVTPPAPPPPSAVAVPREEPQKKKGPPLLLIGVIAVVLVGAIIGAVLALSGGGGGDKKTDTTAVATTTATKTTETATSTGSASATATATPTATATTAAATETTAAATTSAAATATPRPAQATPTPVPPTPVPPTPTPKPSGGNVGNFQVTVTCASALVGYSGSAPGVSVSTSWTVNGAPASFSNTPASTNAASGALQFPTDGGSGTYAVTIYANGSPVASSNSVTC